MTAREFKEITQAWKLRDTESGRLDKIAVWMFPMFVGLFVALFSGLNSGRNFVWLVAGLSAACFFILPVWCKSKAVDAASWESEGWWEPNIQMAIAGACALALAITAQIWAVSVVPYSSSVSLKELTARVRPLPGEEEKTTTEQDSGIADDLNQFFLATVPGAVLALILYSWLYDAMPQWTFASAAIADQRKGLGGNPKTSYQEGFGDTLDGDLKWLAGYVHDFCKRYPSLASSAHEWSKWREREFLNHHNVVKGLASKPEGKTEKQMEREIQAAQHEAALADVQFNAVAAENKIEEIRGPTEEQVRRQLNSQISQEKATGELAIARLQERLRRCEKIESLRRREKNFIENTYPETKQAERMAQCDAHYDERLRQLEEGP